MDLELDHSVSLSSVTLVVLLLIFSCTPAEGNFRVIGSPQPIVAALGDDIILPCHVEPQIDVTGLTVEWSKPDLKPDPNDRLRRVEYVHLYRDAREDLDMKITEYVKRTELFADGLTRGNISLKITNVTFEDEGRYQCFIPKLKSLFKSSIIHLSVEPKSVTTETPLQTPGPTEETDVNGEDNSLERGEHHYKSGHVESCSHADGEMVGLVHASRREHRYKVSTRARTVKT
ncbi:myelin-oligodendrocyte glycoprotein-like isoform X2 [Sparus aurata]|uniref:myelin-oligodendrocyte glycoprotein-like isoform X2 n=1 Tax=Sparus aurata TaxID=8175 RepID=UPI0011C1152C|nr:myelin-oligodendrocyte glycoprotein-like isoform X2 [Sparus aurata]